jgi:sugar phosphate isomerase/epimerase
MIPVALSTGSIYTYGTARAFELAAAAGYDGVELLVDERWDTRQAGYVRRLVDQYDLPVLSVHSPFVAGISGWPRTEVERVKQSLALAEALGARTLNVHLPFRIQDLVVLGRGRRWMLPLPGQDANHREYARWLVHGGLAELQASTAVTIAVENLPVRRILGRRFSPYALNTWEALAAFPRLCLDTTHCGTTGSDLLAVYERLRSRIVHVHLSDYDGRYQHQPVGRGHLPLDRFLAALVATGFPGVVVLELTPYALPAHDEGKLAGELRRNLAYCRRHLGQAVAGDAAPAPPAAVAPSTVGRA